MTRINLVDVKELSDQHLIAEYRELPRCIKQNINISDAPRKYCPNKGHMKWAKLHSRWLMRRYLDITWEMQYRGIKTNYPFYKLYEIYETQYYTKECDNWYNPTNSDIQLSRNRIIEKFNLKPNWYKWTKRQPPTYLTIER